MLRIGLTGGIASGKTTVAGFFADLGADIIDTDEISHRLVAADGAAIDAVVGAFGERVLAADGALDRPKMREIVFSDPKARRTLEAILHPMIRQETLEQAEASNAAYVVIVVPLLFETRFDQLVDRTLVVDCPEDVQLKRLIERDGISRERARSIIETQMDRKARISAADDVIDSSKSLSSVREHVGKLHARYLALSGNC